MLQAPSPRASVATAAGSLAAGPQPVPDDINRRIARVELAELRSDQ